MLKDYYKILEVDYDATEELIRLNYRKLALVSKHSKTLLALRLNLGVSRLKKIIIIFFFLLRMFSFFFVVPSTEVAS